MKKFLIWVTLFAGAVFALIKILPVGTLPDIDVNIPALRESTPPATPLPATKPATPPPVFDAGAKIAIREAILLGLEAVELEIDLASYGVTAPELNLIYHDIIDENPHLFHVNGEYTVSLIDDFAVSLSPKYDGTKQEIIQRKAVFDEEVDRVLAAIPDGISDAEKVLAVNDYIAYNAEYDTSLSRHSAYDLLVRKTAVCEGYSRAFGVIMSRLGIENRIVSSEAMEHGWNMVKVNGNWYHVDVTWNDPTPDQLGRACHKYLLISDEVISDEAHGHYGWNASDCPQATDESFSDAFWTDVDTPIIYHGGKWYFTFSSEGNTHGIVSADLKSGENSVIHTFPSTWFSDENSYWDMGPCLGTYNGQIYYNTADAVYKIDFDGGGLTKVLSERLDGLDAIYEMRISGNELLYRIRSAPSSRAPDYTEKVFILE